MYLIKADKTKIHHIGGYLLYDDIQKATIDEVNSYKPVLDRFYQQRDDIHWIREEYNIVSEKVLLDIVDWLKNLIENENYDDFDDDGRMVRYVYESIKDWCPLKENEVVYFEEDS